MDVLTKLSILSDAAKYDASCSSSGSRRKNTPGGLGDAHASGICHTWSDDGRCVSLLKILYSNACIYDCAYCGNRRSNSVPRASFTVEEVVDLTINFYKRNYIEGLFLSSAVVRDPNSTMEALFRVLKTLREVHRFNGYIHVKAIPGADIDLITRTGQYADRMSVNIELPSEASLNKLAPEKKKDDILLPMKVIGRTFSHALEESRTSRHAPVFVPAGQSTQLIVGASPESDLQILRLTQGLYKAYQLKRVYYSAYIPVNQDNLLPTISAPPVVRENRLYQADWLLRFYGFSAHELLDETHPFLDERLDPKTSWALRHFQLFPVEVNTADYHVLLRVPGIGVQSAQKIVRARRGAALDFETLRRIGVVLKRARYFLTCNGKPFERFPADPERLGRLLSRGGGKPVQLSLF